MHPPAPSEVPRAPGRAPVHAVATAGNAVFVTFLALLLAQDRLFTASPPPAPSPVGAGELRRARSNCGFAADVGSVLAPRMDGRPYARVQAQLPVI